MPRDGAADVAYVGGGREGFGGPGGANEKAPAPAASGAF